MRRLIVVLMMVGYAGVTWGAPGSIELGPDARGYETIDNGGTLGNACSKVHITGATGSDGTDFWVMRCSTGQGFLIPFQYPAGASAYNAANFSPRIDVRTSGQTAGTACTAWKVACSSAPGQTLTSLLAMTFSSAGYAASSDSASGNLDNYPGWTAALASPINTPNSYAGAYAHCAFFVQRVASGGGCTDNAHTTMDYGEAYATFE